MAIVTVAYEVGSGGLEIAWLLAARLGFRYVDHAMIVRAAHRLTLDEMRAARLEPDASPSGRAQAALHTASIRAAIYGFAEVDDVVLADCRAGCLLGDLPHVLRVAIVAALDVRVAHLVATIERPGRVPPPARVRAIVRRHDAPRAAARRIDLHDPLRWDLTINRERVDTSAAVQLLTDLVRGRQWATSDAARTLIRNRALACRVQVALALNATTGSYGIRVAAAEGLVRLEAPELVDEAVEVAREVPGVTRIVMHVAPASEAV